MSIDLWKYCDDEKNVNGCGSSKSNNKDGRYHQDDQHPIHINAQVEQWVMRTGDY